MVDTVATTTSAADVLAGTTPSPAPAAAPTPAPTPSATPTPAPATDFKWDPYAKDEDLGWVQTKYKDPADLIKAHRNLEKTLGADKIALPKDEKDVDGWNKVYDKLGRPKTAAEYKLPLPDNADKGFVEAVTKVMHESGVSQRAAESIVKAYNEYGTKIQADAKAAADAKSRTDMDVLTREWGQAFQQEAEHGTRFCKEFGMEHATLLKIEEAIGTADMLRMFSKFGKALSENKVAEGDPTGFGPMTPEQAKYQITEYMTEISAAKGKHPWSDASSPGHKAAVEKMERLQKAAAPQ